MTAPALPGGAEIAVRAQTETMPHVVISQLEVWAESARLAGQIALQMLGTPFVPATLVAKQTYREQTQEDLDRITLGNITGAILTGHELGLSPMAALRSIDIIKGTPALRAITQRALVQNAGHEVVLAESDAKHALVRGRRRNPDNTWQDPQESLWDLDRARGLGLLGLDQWKKQPKAMLIARATAECCRLVASDVMLAIPYSAEELRDSEALDAQPTSVSVPVRVSAGQVTAAEILARRTKREPVQGEPEQQTTPPEQASEPEAEQTGPVLLTRPQQDRLHINLNRLGVGGAANRDRGLALIGSIIGRRVPTSKVLTLGEAKTLIDALEGEAMTPEKAQATADETLTQYAAEDAPPTDDTAVDAEVVEEAPEPVKPPTAKQMGLLQKAHPDRWRKALDILSGAPIPDERISAALVIRAIEFPAEELADAITAEQERLAEEEADAALAANQDGDQ